LAPSGQSYGFGNPLLRSYLYILPECGRFVNHFLELLSSFFFSLSLHNFAVIVFIVLRPTDFAGTPFYKGLRGLPRALAVALTRSCDSCAYISAAAELPRTPCRRPPAERMRTRRERMRREGLCRTGLYLTDLQAIIASRLECPAGHWTFGSTSLLRRLALSNAVGTP